MKAFAFLIGYFVICANSLDTNETTTTSQDFERWEWGYVEITKGFDSNSTTQLPISPTETPTVTERLMEENPCEEKPPPMPDFSAPGKRISEQKCEEYLWDIQKRLNETARLDACERYLINHQIYPPPAVVGGLDARQTEFPHMGAIGWKAVVGGYIYKCGGSLISSKFVLTAGHCTRASNLDSEIADPAPQIIKFGDRDILDNTNIKIIQRNIKRIIPHPEYKSPKKYNDIALMELDTEIKWFSENVQPACLWHQFDTSPLGKKATVTGWGVLKPSSKDISTILQVAQVDIIDSKECDDLLRPNCNRLWCGIQDTQICAGKLSGGIDACQGDSGGPLQFKIPLPSAAEGAMHYVVGVTSFGFGCALENTPGVYTRVQPYLDWIQSIVWP